MENYEVDATVRVALVMYVQGQLCVVDWHRDEPSDDLAKFTRTRDFLLVEWHGDDLAPEFVFPYIERYLAV